MSRRTFYEHFHDITDALLQLYDTGADLLFRHVEAEYRAAPSHARRLEAGLAAYLTGLAVQADVARVVYNEIRAAGPDHVVRHQATLDRFGQLLAEWAREAGQRPDDTTLQALVAGIEGAAMRRVYRGEERLLPGLAPTFVALARRVLVPGEIG